MDTARIMLIYLCCLLAFIPFIWVVCPETKGRSLEEIGLIFGDRHVRVALDGPELSSEQALENSEKQAFTHVNQAEGEHVER